MTLRPGLRKLVLTAHVTTSVGWLGAVVVYLALVVAAMRIGDAGTVRATWVALELAVRFAIVPLAVASVVIGIINALVAPWGLFRHWWVVSKLALTLLAATILLLHVPTVQHYASLARDGGGAAAGLSGELLHAGGGLIVLLVTTTLSVFKPRGLTKYGWRKLRER